MLPALTHEFGLLPWHFGGDSCLTYAEARAYLDAYHQLAEEQKRQARQAKRTGSGSARRPARRR